MFDVSALIKYLAIVASATFGIVAVFGDTRDKQGHLKFYGYVAIVGLVISGLTGSLTQFFDDQSKIAADISREKQFARDVAWQNNALADIRRELFSIDKWEVSVEATYPSGSSTAWALLTARWDRYLAQHPAPQFTPSIFIDRQNGAAIRYEASPLGGWRPKSLMILAPHSPLNPVPEAPRIATDGPPLTPGVAKQVSQYSLYVGSTQSLTNAIDCQKFRDPYSISKELETHGDMALVLTIPNSDSGFVNFEYDPVRHEVTVDAYFKRAVISAIRRLLAVPDVVGKKILLLSDNSSVLRINKIRLRLAKGDDLNFGRYHVYEPRAEPICGAKGASFTVAPGDYTIIGGSH